MHGISVTPLEWWDGKWLRDRIAKPLKEAGLPGWAASMRQPRTASPRRPPPAPRAAGPARITAPI